MTTTPSGDFGGIAFGIDGLTPNTTYSVKVRVRRKDSQLYTESSAKSITTYDYAKVTSAPNFNDEQNPTINYSNPAGNRVSSLQACISWTGGADIAYRDISKTGSSYTFNFTSAERTALRNSCITANSRKVIFHVRTENGGNKYYSTIEKTLSIVNANPQFSTFEIGRAHV